MNERIRKLEKQIEDLEYQLSTEKLLFEIWLHLGSNTPHLPMPLLIKLQKHFDFDDSE